MRVNTDGVLLGAWIRLPDRADTPKVLDIGTGSGVIALMLAQRLDAVYPSQNFLVDALEPHATSVQRALENFNRAPWSSCMRVFNSTLQKHARTSQTMAYDLIASNPPYFENSLRPPAQDRSWVRHTDLLSYVDLIQGVVSLLHPLGRFGLILPIHQQERFLELAGRGGLFCTRQTCVYTLPHKAPKRVLMEFSLLKGALLHDSLCIHGTRSTDFSDAYKKLLHDFYLAF